MLPLLKNNGMIPIRDETNILIINVKNMGNLYDILITECNIFGFDILKDKENLSEKELKLILNYFYGIKKMHSLTNYISRNKSNPKILNKQDISMFKLGDVVKYSVDDVYTSRMLGYIQDINYENNMLHIIWNSKQSSFEETDRLDVLDLTSKTNFALIVRLFGYYQRHLNEFQRWAYLYNSQLSTNNINFEVINNEKIIKVEFLTWVKTKIIDIKFNRTYTKEFSMEQFVVYSTMWINGDIKRKSFYLLNTVDSEIYLIGVEGIPIREPFSGNGSLNEIKNTLKCHFKKKDENRVFQFVFGEEYIDKLGITKLQIDFIIDCINSLQYAVETTKNTELLKKFLFSKALNKFVLATTDKLKSGLTYYEVGIITSRLIEFKAYILGTRADKETWVTLNKNVESYNILKLYFDL